jgi:hypothetical protein
MGTRMFSLLRHYGTVTTLHYQLLQQRWHYWVKGTSHMQHHQGNPICHNTIKNDHSKCFRLASSRTSLSFWAPNQHELSCTMTYYDKITPRRRWKVTVSGGVRIYDVINCLSKRAEHPFRQLFIEMGSKKYLCSNVKWMLQMPDVIKTDMARQLLYISPISISMRTAYLVSVYIIPGVLKSVLNHVTDK